VVEIAVGIAMPVLMLGLRLPLSEIVGDRAPYAFMFIAAAAATILAGWRSGLLSVFIGQLLSWFFIVQPAAAFEPATTQVSAGLVIATISQLLTVLVIALYQREVDKGVHERERRMALLDEALKEIDHRTRNNYQTVLALIELQSRRAADDGVRSALRQVSERIQAVADASQRLAAHSTDLTAVRLDDHLCGLVQQIGRGLSRDGIDIDCQVDEVTASPEKATSISIIVNELVTNAIKHAFNGEGSGHVIVTGRHGSDFELIVTDDGRGMGGPRRAQGNGLGSRLVESFVRQLGASHEVQSSDQGTTHRLLIPSLS
jgi:two-component sensor histidine kinase